MHGWLRHILYIVQRAANGCVTLSIVVNTCVNAAAQDARMFAIKRQNNTVLLLISNFVFSPSNDHTHTRPTPTRHPNL